MAADVERKLTQFNYTGEKRNQTFDKYATLHKEQDNILERLN